MIYDQLYPYLEKIFSKFLRRFRKSFTAQRCFDIIDWKIEEISKSSITGLSKAFDSIDHEFLLAKLYAYSVDKNSLYFIHFYLS